MDQYKTLVESKTFWGAIMAIVGSVVSFGHYTITPADAASAVDLVVGAVTAISGLMAIYGRILATHRIDGVIP